MLSSPEHIYKNITKHNSMAIHIMNLYHTWGAQHTSSKDTTVVTSPSHTTPPAYNCGYLPITHNTPSIQLRLPPHHTQHPQPTTEVTSPSHTTPPAYNCGYLPITHNTPSIQLRLPPHHTQHPQRTAVVTSPSHTTPPAYNCGYLPITQ